MSTSSSPSSQPPPESFATLTRRLLQELTARGLQFERASTPDDSLRFLHPRGWHAAWREDHLAITHGVPPKGWLTLYPVPLTQKISPEVLMDAFLEEFVEPATTELSIVSRARLSRAPEVEGLELRLLLAGRWCYGLALARVQLGQGRMISYWVEEGLFRRNPVEDLLLMLLGNEEVPADSRFAEKHYHLEPLNETLLWPMERSPEGLRPGQPSEGEPFGAQRGRFALFLPPGWQGLEVQQEDSVGWLLQPPGVQPDDPHAPLIAITGADLLHPLEETLHQAITRLVSEEHFSPELPAREVPLRDHFALLQVWKGEGATLGQPVRLWSLGVTDGASVVHLFAMTEGQALPGLLLDLANIGATLKVLPRVPNRALMGQLLGHWRFVEGGDKENEGLETLVELRADDLFATTSRGINVLARETRGAAARRAEAAALLSGQISGRWEVVDETLHLYRDEGDREVFQVESLGERSAIIGGVFWEKL